mmetsp:Transcript_3494/g.11596  ORF Transcript_3494/g.11596 Transcript_3494/m.11596 type:complete len:207 (-) Transcript_3494:54-674(-)
MAAIDAHAMPRRRLAVATPAGRRGGVRESLADGLLEKVHHPLVVRKDDELARPLAPLPRVCRRRGEGAEPRVQPRLRLGEGHGLEQAEAVSLRLHASSLQAVGGAVVGVAALGARQVVRRQGRRSKRADRLPCVAEGERQVNLLIEPVREVVHHLPLRAPHHQESVHEQWKLLRVLERRRRRGAVEEARVVLVLIRGEQAWPQHLE